jgi:quercetin dioxygenase-like cupin family protein
MARAGDVIKNPLTGERVVFHQTGQETNGELLRFEVIAAPSAIGPPEHVHPQETEFIEVLAGTLVARIAGEMKHFAAGDVFSIPAGTPHRWWNESGDEARVMVEFRPAGRMDRFLETLFALAKDGKTDDRGVPNPLQMAVIAQEYFDTNHLARPPVVIQRALFAVLAPLARWRGFRADYPYKAEPGQVQIG